MSDYDPFIRGPFTVQARTTEAHDTSRDRVFKCEIWNPSAAGTHPLVVYSHFSGGKARAPRFLCVDIWRHGSVVAGGGYLERGFSDPVPGEHVSRRNHGAGAGLRQRLL